MTDWIAAGVTLIVVTVLLYGLWRYLRRIRRGDADPVISPAWTSTMLPTTTNQTPMPDRSAEHSRYEER